MESKFKRVMAIIIAALMLMLSGCKSVTKANDNNKSDLQKPIVYASIYPMYEFAKNIGGDKIDLRQLIPSGTEPHDWEPAAKIMGEMEKADVFIYNGAGMEPWVEKLAKSIDSDNLITVDASEGIELLNEEGHEGEVDPHIWLDPTNAAKQAQSIKNAFVKIDEANKDFYENNFREFAQKLSDLDKEYKEGLSDIKRKEIVVAHAAFGYMAQRYGLVQVAVRGVNAEDEPTPSEMGEITELLKSKNIKYIFFETLTTPRLSQVLASEVGAKTSVLNPIDGLTEEDIKAGKTYISIMKENLEALKKALGE